MIPRFGCCFNIYLEIRRPPNKAVVCYPRQWKISTPLTCPSSAQVRNSSSAIHVSPSWTLPNPSPSAILHPAQEENNSQIMVSSTPNPYPGSQIPRDNKR
jgi:hypothetical protein